jgi:transposase
MMCLGSRGISASIKECANKKRRRTGSHCCTFSYKTYAKIKSNVERFFSRLKSFSRIQIRYDDTDTHQHISRVCAVRMCCADINQTVYDELEKKN